MQFKNVIGQEAIKERLIRSVHEKRIPHAQLFHGPEGTGKLAMALAYAQFISCTQRTETDSCGVCPSCIKYEKLAHPDLHFVFPVAGSSERSEDHLPTWRTRLMQSPYLSYNEWLSSIASENKQGIIGKTESEEIIRKLAFKTFESDYKILIMWLPEKMNSVAANKLLKILEEPWEFTVFLLVSNQPNFLLSTILSRTQALSFPPIAEQALSLALTTNLSIEKNRADELAKLAQGNYFQAIQGWQSSEENKVHFDRFTQWMRLAYQKNVIELHRISEELAGAGREAQKQFLVYALKMIQQSFMMNQQQKELVYLPEEERTFVDRFAPFIKSTIVTPLYEELNKASYHIERNGNPKIIFLDTSLRIIQLLHS